LKLVDILEMKAKDELKNNSKIKKSGTSIGTSAILRRVTSLELI
jgi:hypothetical protein